MTAAVFAYSRQGLATARRVRTALGGEVRGFAAARLAEGEFAPVPQPSRALYGEMFRTVDALVFVGSCGIAVRQIAPFVESKTHDPAVVVIDELGRFVIPLLSGHIGGANALAGELAEALGATAVITTATDINRKFSVDAWAARQGLAISSMAAAKAVSAAILEGEVPIASDFPMVGEYPPGTVAGENGKVGIMLTFREKEPFSCTLRLIPKILHLGIGCRRNTPEEAIQAAVEAVLLEHGIDRRGIKCAASIDLKKDEAGLLAFCRTWALPIEFYPAARLREVAGEFTPSAFVSSVTGVDNVCERSAMVGAERLVVKKTARSGVTVAVAAEQWEVRFG